MKRKATEDVTSQSTKKKKSKSPGSVQNRFRDGLFEEAQLKAYTESYAISQPYKHGVIQSLISGHLLCAVRSEIQENISFTPKETDIYRIHQSGDLANLDGLDDSSLKLLPSLLSLRDALYSPDFREYLSSITGAGSLSGRKTDMAVNVYTPGCHLLCHDDVIGTRRVSYILYLTDPDEPWQDEWGGALRLYPTLKLKDEGEDGKSYKVPSPDESVRIPPAFGQLSFFAVQPGESFHDVEEVFASRDSGGGDTRVENEKRVRMAISGWYHIPQEGEEGYEPGLEEKLAEKSSLMQLQGKADQFDLPRSASVSYKPENTNEPESEEATAEQQVEAESLSESDLTFLLNYLAPTYLTPDTLESVAAAFTNQCSLVLDSVLSRKFSDSLRKHIIDQESHSLPAASEDIESKTPWKVARPPHKHRFLFQQPKPASTTHAPVPGLQTPPASFPQPEGSQTEEAEELSPIQALLTNLLPSTAFKKWLQLATSQTLLSHNLLARRFRRGKDYTLATGYDEDSPRLEITLAVTPTKGWGDEVADGEEAEVVEPSKASTEGKLKDSKAEPEAELEPEPPGVGGYLAYMAGDDDAPDPNDSASDDAVEVPPSLSTAARSTGSKPKKPKSDPAVYKAAEDPEDDGVLFSMPASWNRLGIVLRDQGTMRFVKYVSQAAKGHRWDLVGEFGIVDQGEENEDEDEEEQGEGDNDNRNVVGVEDEETEVEVLGTESDESSD